MIKITPVQKVTKRELALRKVSEHVCNEFNLGEDFVITDFKAKNHSITLANQDYEINVKVMGEASFSLQNEIYEALDELKKSEKPTTEEEIEE